MISMDSLSNFISIPALVLSIILSFLSLQILKRKLNGKKKYHPVAGTMFNQLLNFNRVHDYMTDLAAKHKTYRLLSPFRNEIYTSDPANVEYILKTNFENYGKGMYNYCIFRDLLGDGIFTVDGDKWRQQRKVSSHEFSTKVLRDFSSVIFQRSVSKLANIISKAATSNQVMDLQSKSRRQWMVLDHVHHLISFALWYQSHSSHEHRSCEGSSMASMESLSSSLPPNLTLLISNLNSFVTVKLDTTNYIVWKNQFQNILRATNLLSYVDGSSVCPSLTVVDSSGKTVTNPEVLTWKLIDSHLLSCITATLTPAVFTSVVHCATCTEVWSLLAKKFTSLSRSHIHQLKNKLNNISKKSSSMDEYLQKIKNISDQLSLAGSPIEDEDLVLITLNGLPAEFNALKTTVRARSEAIAMEELASLLCSEALHVESDSKDSISDLTVAYSTTRDSHQSRFNTQSASTFRSNSNSYHRGNNFSRGGRFRGNRRGGSRSSHTGRQFPHASSSSASSFGGSALFCQICGKPNHTALDCWFRMDASYQSSSSASSPSSPSPTAYASYQSSSPAPPANWYVDSAATTHVTNDLSNLQQYSPYYGSDSVTVGNGSSVPIRHTGQGQAFKDSVV